MKEDTEPRPGRPRSETARRAILRASLELLRRHGLSGVTAEAVADRAKVSKATLYRWWPCAAATAMDAFFEEVFAHLHVVASDDPLADLRNRLKHGTELMAGELGDVMAGLIATTHTDPRVAESFQQRYVEPGRKDFRRMLQRAVDAGALRADIDLELAIDVISGAFFYRKMVCHRTTSPRAMASILGYVLEGLGARPDRAPRRATTKRAPRAHGTTTSARIAAAGPARRRAKSAAAKR
jgi:AcrR family transcriptional regulator